MHSEIDKISIKLFSVPYIDRTGLAKYLIKRGANVNLIVNNSTYTPLLFAIENSKCCDFVGCSVLPIDDDISITET